MKEEENIKQAELMISHLSSLEAVYDARIKLLKIERNHYSFFSLGYLNLSMQIRERRNTKKLFTKYKTAITSWIKNYKKTNQDIEFLSSIFKSTANTINNLKD